MSDLIGSIKHENGYYWVKNPKDEWEKVCQESDPFWAPKCVQIIEQYYPTK